MSSSKTYLEFYFLREKLCLTAISQTDPSLSGQVIINTLDVDPSQGLVNLPAELVDASGLIASGCGASGRQGESEFIVTGRGGLPDNPTDTLSSEAVQVDLVTLNPSIDKHSSPDVSTPTALAPLVEAQGWVIGDNGGNPHRQSAHRHAPQSMADAS